MPGEETILEGPVTPAPVFAYRAIRSIFFASPESSPEHGDKENLVPVYPSSPKRKYVAEDSPVPSPSQKRQRDTNAHGGRNILSPTKGILRTPGLATPRAKYLKDINVKFKSVSPEAPKLPILPVSPRQPRSKAQDAPAALGHLKPIHNLIPPTKTKPTSVLQDAVQDEQLLVKSNPAAASAPSTSPCLLSRAAIEAYIAQTEKEMKKLVRYGQKMREYARKKDAENQELKGMIDQLRRENERLRRETDSAAECHRGGSDLEQVDRHLTDEKGEKRWLSAGTLGTNASPALRDKPRAYVREEVDRVETTVRSQTVKESKGQRHTSLSGAETAERSAGIYDPARPPSDHLPSIKRSISTSTSQRIASTSTSIATTRLADIPGNLPQSTEVIPAAASSSTSSTTTAIRSASASTIAARPGKTSLPPDRVAAARDRLRRRYEARKASVPVDVGSTLNEQGEEKGEGYVEDDRHLLGMGMGTKRERAQELAQQSEEPSEVDWVNL
ncbi:hypothetical protein AYL99_03547 [Fonsecaea erecta]|uniref:Spindle pole body-associated protein cut12 domain-containing protein n=1 Tax=Fonsecaea erecta TaxID=1367422 RepID=A0A178ZND8_9EURO|nr:hypothetical protein AYL99_03547 [Fonsecaea erecta]OAP61344.1 hypothetical protein AYL99_03547 [Fonsecaea erecta]